MSGFIQGGSVGAAVLDKGATQRIFYLYILDRESGTVTDLLVRIKRAVLAGNYRFSEKALIELDIDHLSELDVVESISNAVAIYKRIRSTSPRKGQGREYLYIIHSPNLEGLPIYTKGKFVKVDGRELFYFLVSSKRAN